MKLNRKISTKGWFDGDDGGDNSDSSDTDGGWSGNDGDNHTGEGQHDGGHDAADLRGESRMSVKDILGDISDANNDHEFSRDHPRDPGDRIANDGGPVIMPSTDYVVPIASDQSIFSGGVSLGGGAMFGVITAVGGLGSLGLSGDSGGSQLNATGFVPVVGLGWTMGKPGIGADFNVRNPNANSVDDACQPMIFVALPGVSISIGLSDDGQSVTGGTVSIPNVGLGIFGGTYCGTASPTLPW